MLAPVTAAMATGEGIPVRLDIEGKHMTLAPHLVGWIAQRLEKLNTPYDDICEARVTFVQQGRRDAVCVELLLAGKSLHVTRRGATPDAAVDATFRTVQQELYDVRAARRARLSVGVARETWRAPVPIVAGKIASSARQA
jgi:ribosome-associated translation inhibitor RaiA